MPFLFMVKVKVKLVVKDISNVKFCALFKGQGLPFKKSNLTFKVMGKVMVKVTMGQPGKNPKSLVLCIYISTSIVRDILLYRGFWITLYNSANVLISGWKTVSNGFFRYLFSIFFIYTQTLFSPGAMMNLLLVSVWKY